MRKEGVKRKIKGSKARLARLTEKRRQWAAARNRDNFTGNALWPNKAIEAKYRNKLKGLVSLMERETKREIKRLMRTKEGRQIFNDATFATMARWSLNKLRAKFRNLAQETGKPVVEGWIEDVDKNASATLAGSLKKASGGIEIKTNGVNDQINNMISATITENVNLIKTITSDYFDQITGVVMRSIQAGGGGSAEIFDQIDKIGQVSQNRAELIARDQTSKANTAIEVARMNTCGVKKFEWLHSGGGKEPRPLHVRYNGQVFECDNPPIIDERTGERGFPGQLINCRCVMRPIISFD